MSIANLLYELKTEKEKYEKTVTQNGVNDMPQYKFLVGHIEGLEKAIAICKNIFNGETNND